MQFTKRSFCKQLIAQFIFSMHLLPKYYCKHQMLVGAIAVHVSSLAISGTIFTHSDIRNPA